jgi:hypothetical protein
MSLRYPARASRLETEPSIGALCARLAFVWGVAVAVALVASMLGAWTGR